jgi:hypothetical protein
MGTVPLKTVIVSLDVPQQGDGPVPTFVPVMVTTVLAGVGDNLCNLIF